MESIKRIIESFLYDGGGIRKKDCKEGQVGIYNGGHQDWNGGFKVPIVLRRDIGYLIWNSG